MAFGSVKKFSSLWIIECCSIYLSRVNRTKFARKKTEFLPSFGALFSKRIVFFFTWRVAAGRTGVLEEKKKPNFPPQREKSKIPVGRQRPLQSRRGISWGRGGKQKKRRRRRRRRRKGKEGDGKETKRKKEERGLT